MSLSAHQSARMQNDEWLTPTEIINSLGVFDLETVWAMADAVLFIQGRPHFHRVNGDRAPFNSGAPICLVAYGISNVAALERSGLGVVISVPRQKGIAQ